MSFSWHPGAALRKPPPVSTCGPRLSHQDGNSVRAGSVQWPQSPHPWSLIHLWIPRSCCQRPQTDRPLLVHLVNRETDLVVVYCLCKELNVPTGNEFTLGKVHKLPLIEPQSGRGSMILQTNWSLPLMPIYLHIPIAVLWGQMGLYFNIIKWNPVWH